MDSIFESNALRAPTFSVNEFGGLGNLECRFVATKFVHGNANWILNY